MGDLNFRSRRILYATISEYIATGEPVGSRRLAKRYGLNLSPATIRNVLADLEEAGFLQQPHTSAGRVPTEHGFRVFVNALVQMREVSQEERAAVLARLTNLDPQADLLHEAGEVLSSLTGAAAVLTPPKPDEEQLAQVRFLLMAPKQVLGVLISKTGSVQNRVLHLPDPIEAGPLERINNLIAELLETPQSLRALRSALADRMDTERGTVAELRRVAHSIVEAAAEGSTSNLRIEGQGRLFDRPEFIDSDKIRRYLRAFDDKERLLGLLDSTLQSGGVHVLIGSEANLVDIEDVTVISSTYTKGGGSLGVIAPARLDYAKVVPLVGFTAKVMRELFDANEEDD